MASTKEKKLTKYEQNTARRNARSIGDSGTSQTAQSSAHKSDKQRQLEQFAQNFEQKYGSKFKLRTTQTLQSSLEQPAKALYRIRLQTDSVCRCIRIQQLHFQISTG